MRLAELAPVADSSLVPHVVAAAVGVREQAQRTRPEGGAADCPRVHQSRNSRGVGVCAAHGGHPRRRRRQAAVRSTKRLGFSKRGRYKV